MDQIEKQMIDIVNRNHERHRRQMKRIAIGLHYVQYAMRLKRISDRRRKK